jgi:2,5-diamino-6-(ribosylamino)-4(3H)-pyrimidinone 5'-phosphate reductase
MAAVVARPYVVVHVAVSVDGATTGFPADVGSFYRLATTWHEDVTLTGAATVLAQEAALREGPRPGPSPDGPILAVVDSQARVHEWAALREAGYWSDVIALRSNATPQHDDPGVVELVAGSTRVDLTAALRLLRDRGASLVRVDSGGGLIGALLRANLVDEVSLLVHPSLSDGTGHPWYGGPDVAAAVQLDLMAAETLEQLVWLRYRVA